MQLLPVWEEKEEDEFRTLWDRYEADFESYCQSFRNREDVLTTAEHHQKDVDRGCPKKGGHVRENFEGISGSENAGTQPSEGPMVGLPLLFLQAGDSSAEPGRKVTLQDNEGGTARPEDAPERPRPLGKTRAPRSTGRKRKRKGERKGETFKRRRRGDGRRRRSTGRLYLRERALEETRRSPDRVFTAAEEEAFRAQCARSNEALRSFEVFSEEICPSSSQEEWYVDRKDEHLDLFQ